MGPTSPTPAARPLGRAVLARMSVPVVRRAIGARGKMTFSSPHKTGYACHLSPPPPRAAGFVARLPPGPFVTRTPPPPGIVAR